MADPMSRPDVVVVTGMSGAGRSTAANALEDLGWFVVDNMPPALLPTLVDLAGRGTVDDLDLQLVSGGHAPARRA